jgi:hypothetical protein
MATKNMVLVDTIPEDSRGKAGDKAGMFAFDNTNGYIYFATQDYDGSYHIWQRLPLTNEQWPQPFNWGPPPQ